MIIGRIIGTVISTRKHQTLVGSKFMIVEPVSQTGTNRIVAVDNIGAGIGELVLVATGGAARTGCGNKEAPVDALVVGIVDDPGKINIAE